MRSTRYAALIAGGYALLAVIYIVASTAIAARLSVSVTDLRRIELIKGILYVIVTALAVFAATRVALARIERDTAEISTRDRALVASERRVLAGMLAGSVAHDVNNVLTAVLGDLDELGAAPGGHVEVVGRLHASVDRLIALNRRLIQLASHVAPGAADDTDLVAVVSEVLETLRSHPRVRRCDIRLTAPDALVVRSHPMPLQQIVSNLVLNACEAGEGQAHVTVRVAHEEGRAVLEVCDDGPGVPAARRAGIFDAMETTKPHGSGLGLFSVKSCARALGGDVAVCDSPLGGACFRVRLPLQAPTTT